MLPQLSKKRQLHEVKDHLQQGRMYRFELPSASRNGSKEAVQQQRTTNICHQMSKHKHIAGITLSHDSIPSLRNLTSTLFPFRPTTCLLKVKAVLCSSTLTQIYSADRNFSQKTENWMRMGIVRYINREANKRKAFSVRTVQILTSVLFRRSRTTPSCADSGSRTSSIRGNKLTYPNTGTSLQWQ